VLNLQQVYLRWPYSLPACSDAKRNDKNESLPDAFFSKCRFLFGNFEHVESYCASNFGKVE